MWRSRARSGSRVLARPRQRGDRDIRQPRHDSRPRAQTRTGGIRRAGSGALPRICRTVGLRRMNCRSIAAVLMCDGEPSAVRFSVALDRDGRASERATASGARGDCTAPQCWARGTVPSTAHATPWRPRARKTPGLAGVPAWPTSSGLGLCVGRGSHCQRVLGSLIASVPLCRELCEARQTRTVIEQYLGCPRLNFEQ